MKMPNLSENVEIENPLVYTKKRCYISNSIVQYSEKNNNVKSNFRDTIYIGDTA